MYRMMTAGLWVLGVAVGGAAAALAQEGWTDAEWWQQATLAAVQERLDGGAELTAQDGATALTPGGDVQRESGGGSAAAGPRRGPHGAG